MSASHSGASPEPPSREAAARGLATVGYALQAASLVLGITLLVGAVIVYVKRYEARGTWVESHFRWQIRTFWGVVIGFLLLGLTVVLLTLGAVDAAASGSDAGAAGGVISAGTVGIGGGLALFAWFVYRVIRGWRRLAENRPV